MIIPGRLILLALPFVFASCAPPAYDIEPNFLDSPDYYGAGCSMLARSRARVAQRLIFSGLQQDQISRDDRTRTLGVPAPFGSLFEGSQELEVSRLKGELRKINDEVRAAQCESS